MKCNYHLLCFTANLKASPSKANIAWRCEDARGGPYDLIKAASRRGAESDIIAMNGPTRPTVAVNITKQSFYSSED